MNTVSLNCLIKIICNNVCVNVDRVAERKDWHEMLEREVEKYLRDQVKKAGGKAYKFESPGNDGVPDRIVIFPKNRIYFIELKRPGGKPRPLQEKKITELKNYSCKVGVIDTKEKVDQFVKNVIDHEI